MSETSTTSRFAQALRSDRPAIIADFPSTLVSDADALKRLAAGFPPSLDALVVCENGPLSAVACSTLLAAQGMEPVLTLSTAVRNRVALLSDARGAALLNVRNVLCIAGDHPSVTASPGAAGAFDIDPTQLLELLRNDEATSSLLLGAEVYPQLRPLQLALIDTRKKVAAGAQFLVTQPVSDFAAFDEWMTAVRAEGLSDKAAILASVQASASDGEAGLATSAELAATLKDVEGVRGLHICSTDKPEGIAEIVRRAGLSVA